MLTPTIGPNWGSTELQDKTAAFKQLVTELEDPDVDTKLTPEQKAEKQTRATELTNTLIETKLQYDSKVNEIYALISQAGVSPKSPFTIEEKFAKLDQAKEIASGLLSRFSFDDVIDAQVELMLSPEADAFPVTKRLEASSVLIVELAPRFDEVAKRESFVRTRIDAAIDEHSFEKARFYSDEAKKFPEQRALVQAPIDLLALASAKAIRGISNPEPITVLLYAVQTMLELPQIGQESKAELQDAMLTLVSNDFISQYPSPAFRFATMLVKTAEGDPDRQVKSINLMFESLKAQITFGYTPSEIRESLESLMPWGVPLKSAVVQRFLDTQIESLRKDNALCGRYYGPATPGQS